MIDGLPIIPFLLAIAVRTTIMLVLLVLGIRVFGKHNLGEMNLPDVALVLLLGNAVQNSLSDSTGSIWAGLISAGSLLLINKGISMVFARHPTVEKKVVGGPAVIVTDGHIDKRTMKKERVTQNELNIAMRQLGITELSNVRVAVLEEDGTISVIPKDKPNS